MHLRLDYITISETLEAEVTGMFRPQKTCRLFVFRFGKDNDHAGQ